MKKLISVFLSLIIVLSTLSVLTTAVSAASYTSNAYYASSSNAGSNIRSGPGTNYSRVGAVSKGVEFYVSKVSGDWAYSSSINSTTGKKSGWVNLNYCKKISSGHTHSYTGGRYYETAHPHAISVRCSDYSSCGGWKWTGENYKLKGCSKCYPTNSYCTLTYNANGGSGAPAAQKVQSDQSFYLSKKVPVRSGYTFLGWSVNKSASKASYAPGAGVRITSDRTLYAIWKSNYVAPTSISLDLTSFTIEETYTKLLKATVYPSNATDKSVRWTSSDSNIVKVYDNGGIAALNPGTATITAKTSNGKTATCKITVKGVRINYPFGYSSPKIGDVFQLSATAYPSDTSKFTWSTSNSKILSVNSKGKITAKGAGTATITAKTADGRTQSIYITVANTEKWATGYFDSGHTAKGYTTVTLNKNAGDAYVYIYSYDRLGCKSSGQMHVTLRDTCGRWIWEGDISSGSKLRLGTDHSQYRVYIAKKSYPDTFSGNSSNFSNSGKCYTWGINAKTNCYIR